MRFVRVWYVAMIMAVLAAPGWAGNWTPEPDMFTLSGDGSMVSSDCVGKLTSPQCVIDTMMACVAWTPDSAKPGPDFPGGYHPVCDVLRAKPGNTGMVPMIYPTGIWPDPNNVVVHYRIATFPITEDNMTDFDKRRLERERRYGAPPWEIEAYMRPGDLGVAVFLRWCEPNEACHLPEKDGQPTRYRKDCPFDDCGNENDVMPPRMASAVVLRQQDEGTWSIVTVFTPYRDRVWPYLEDFYRRRMR